MSFSTADTYYENGLAAIERGCLEAAEREFRRAVETDPSHASGWSKLGWLTFGLGRDLNDARSCLERAVNLDPALGIARVYLGVVYNRLERVADSEASFLLALELGDHLALVHAVYAEEFLWRRSRYGDAEENFRAALDHDSESVLALRDYARMLACHGRDTEARRYFEKAISLDPDDRFTIKAYEEFLQEVAAEDRDPTECLQAAVDKDKNYTEGIRCLERRQS
ncbi:MAG: tetratricopeptide repeat protein [Planctomycetota bacterium]|nr:MAG: tetratricopeptide repeat protein [Planctomycetota bacterium]